MLVPSTNPGITAARRGQREARRARFMRGWRRSLIDYLQNGFPRLHVGEDFNIVGGLGECGRVVIGVDDQDVDSHWGALLDTIRCHHLETRKVCRSTGLSARLCVFLKDSILYLFVRSSDIQNMGRSKMEQADHQSTEEA